MPEKEETVFSVGGISNFFLIKADAQKIGDLLKDIQTKMVSTSYFGSDYSLNWICKWHVDNYSFNKFGEVTSTKMYKKETLEGLQDLLARNKENKKKYDATLSDYNTAKDASKSIRENIYNVYYDVVKTYDDLNDMKRRYDEYLGLADGNQETALKFLKKAYSVNRQTENYILYGSVEDQVSAAPSQLVNN